MFVHITVELRRSLICDGTHCLVTPFSVVDRSYFFLRAPFWSMAEVGTMFSVAKVTFEAFCSSPKFSALSPPGGGSWSVDFFSQTSRFMPASACLFHPIEAESGSTFFLLSTFPLYMSLRGWKISPAPLIAFAFLALGSSSFPGGLPSAFRFLFQPNPDQSPPAWVFLGL